MSVTNGELANASTFNTSFMSREADTSTVAKVGLLDADTAASGPTIANLQKAVNQALTLAPVIDAIAAGGQITLSAASISMERRRVKGTPGDITMNALPFLGGPFLDGKTVRLTGVDAAAKVTLTNNDAAGGVLFNGGSVELGLFDSVALEYYLAQDRWIELGRNS